MRVFALICLLALLVANNCYAKPTIEDLSADEQRQLLAAADEIFDSDFIKRYLICSELHRIERKEELDDLVNKNQLQKNGGFSEGGVRGEADKYFTKNCQEEEMAVFFAEFKVKSTQLILNIYKQTSGDRLFAISSILGELLDKKVAEATGRSHLSLVAFSLIFGFPSFEKLYREVQISESLDGISVRKENALNGLLFSVEKCIFKNNLTCDLRIKNTTNEPVTVNISPEKQSPALIDQYGYAAYALTLSHGEIASRKELDIYASPGLATVMNITVDAPNKLQIIHRLSLRVSYKSTVLFGIMDKNIDQTLVFTNLMTIKMR